MTQLLLGSAELDAITLSFKVTLTALVASLPIGILVGWLLARRQFRGKVLLETLCMLPLVLPPVVVGYLLLILFGRRGPIGRALEHWLGASITFTWWGAALAAGVVGFPLLVRSVKIGFAAIDPRLETMARSLGAGRMRAFFSVSVPLSWSAIVSGAVLAFARGWGEFGATIVVAGSIAGQTRTVPLAIYGALETPNGLDRAWGLVVVSILVAAAAIGISEWLARRGNRDNAARND